jgi:hypothetical protein
MVLLIVVAMLVGPLIGEDFVQPETIPAVAPSAPTPPTPPTSPAKSAATLDVQRVLDTMGKAVVAGDAAAYAACIFPRSPFFLVEQAEWAKDLLKHETKPVAFTAAAVSDGTVASCLTSDGQTVETWTGAVRFAWTMPTTGEAKKSAEASVEFEAVFMRAAGSTAWKYAGEALDMLDVPVATTHATIHYPKGAKVPADQIAKAFPAAKAHVDAFFGREIDRVEEIRLYDRRDVLQLSVYPSMFQTDTTLSGWSETGQSIKFLTMYARDEKGWTAAFAHEYGHVATWNLGDKAAATPWWLQEGIAELAAESFTGGRSRINPIIVAWAKKNELATWDEITDYRKTPQTKRRQPYHQGHHMVGFVHDTKGREMCIAWIAAMAGGKSLDEASREVLGTPFADLDTAWRAHVADLVAKTEAEDAGKRDERR